MSTTHALMAKFPLAAVFLGGDKNSLPLAPLLAALPRFVQTVAHSTHKDNIIDVILMNCGQFYAVPDVTAPVLADNPQRAKPSDHRVPIARPLALASQPISNTYNVRICRPLPESTVRIFMQWIHSEKWDSVPSAGSTTAQVAAFEELVRQKVDELFPKMKIRVTKKDKEFITAELKTLDRKKQREWRKNGRSDLYLRLKKDFEGKYKKAASEHLKKCVSDLKLAQPGRAAATLKRLGAQPGDCAEGAPSP